MPGWSLRPFRRPLAPEPADPATEAAVAARLLPHAREILVAIRPDGGGEAYDLALEAAPASRITVLAPPEVGAHVIERLLERGCVVQEASLALKRDVLVLDRRVGWRLQPWEPLANAFQIAHRLLWARLGYYTVQTGTVETVHAAERLFTFQGSQLWINAAYRDLPAPRPGERLRVLGLISYIGTGLPVLHALTIGPLPSAW